ncbi:MAG: efflux RND transporter permease subunit [Planctomycetota bacterium]
MTSAPRSTGGFFGLTVSRPIAMGVLFVTAVLIGAIAYTRIPLKFLPSGIDGSRFTVLVPNAGATAQENVDKVARIMEEQFRTLPNIADIRSYSGTDSVRLRVQFDGNADGDLSKAELRDRIERARVDLPEDVDRFYLWSSDDSDPPIVWLALVATERSANVAPLVDKYVYKALEGIDGVSRVQIWGLLNESIRILLDEEKVAAAQLDLGALIRRLRTDNFAQPLGEIEDGGTEFLLRSDMRFRDLEEVRNYPVREGLRLRDIASVERINSVRDEITRIDGGYAYYGQIQKESSANVVTVGREIADVLNGLKDDPQLRGKISAEVLFNQADFIESSLDQLKSTAVIGGGLAVLVLFLFLRRARMTLCVALCIPVSALLAIAFEGFRGGTFNVLTMTGLTLGIGMLVDNAVVVIESIARQRGRGLPPREAAILGTRDVGLAVALATFTSIVVFLPLAFMIEGQLGVFFAAMGVPLCASLLFSLIVALVFVPTAASRVIGDRPAGVQRVAALLAPIAALPSRGLAYVLGGIRAGWYALLRGLHAMDRAAIRAAASPLRFALALGLAWVGFEAWNRSQELAEVGRGLQALGAPGGTVSALEAASTWIVRVTLGALLVLLLVVPRLRKKGSAPPPRPATFVPTGHSIVAWMQESNRALLDWTLRHRALAITLSLIALGTIVLPWGNAAISAFGDDDNNTELEFWVDLENNFTLAEASDEMQRYEDFVNGYRDEFGFRNVVARFQAGWGEIELRWPERVDPRVLEEYRDRLREEMPRYAGHEVKFRGQGEISDSSKSFASFEIRGPDPDELTELGELAVGILEQVPGLSDVTSSTEEAPEQLLLEIDGDTAFSFGVNSQSTTQSVGWALRGVQLPRFQEEDQETAFLIEYDSTEAPGLDTLNDLRVIGEDGSVPVAAYSKVRFEQAPSRIRRRNGQARTRITARLDDPTRQSDLVREGYAALDGIDLPRGYSLGRDESVVAQGEEELAAMKKTMALSVVFVFLLMGILFESLLLPLSVLTTIPFAMLGAFWTLWVTDTPMDTVGWIGIVILGGVVVNNGIVLIDKIHRQRTVEGLSRSEAVLTGAHARVRPIVMTALTTVVGLLPMATSSAPAQGIDYRALATCVAGGLAICTFFTLWVVPLAYTVFDDLSRWLGWLLRRSFVGPNARIQPVDVESGAGPRVAPARPIDA